MASGTQNMTTDKARLLSTTGGTTKFWRGDNSWSDTFKQTSSAGLGIDTNLKIGTARKDLNFDVTNGTGTDINSGNASGITWGSGTSAYAGIYYQTSHNYGSRLHFATTTSYANGAYTRLFIAHDGNIGINTLSPSQKLEVNGTARFNNTVYFANGTTYRIDQYGNAKIYTLTTDSSATIKGTMRLNYSQSDIITYYRYSNNTNDSGYFGLSRTNPGDNDLYYNVRFRFLQYSYDSSSKARLNSYEYFDLPQVTANITTSVGYDIRTSKSSAYNVDTATHLSSAPNNTTTFYRGDKTWSNILAGPLNIDTTTNSGTQSTHKLYVNGDSAFEGKIAFGHAAANAITNYAYLQWNSTDQSIDFVFA